MCTMQQLDLIRILQVKYIDLAHKRWDINGGNYSE